MKKIEVLLADDHALVRQGLRALLKNEEHIEIVSEAEDGHKALAQVEELIKLCEAPQIAIIDISMPLLNGLEVTRRLKKVSPKTKVILLSMYKTEEHAREAVKAGAWGYVLKEEAVGKLIEAIHTVMKGDYYFASPILKTIISSMYQRPESHTPGYESLTPREREILQLIAEGYTSKEMAKILFRSVETIRSHRANMMKKLDIHNVTDLVRFAIKEGIVAKEIRKAKVS